MIIGGYTVDETLYTKATDIESTATVNADIDDFWEEYYSEEKITPEPTYPVKFWHRWQYWIRHKVLCNGNWMDA